MFLHHQLAAQGTEFFSSPKKEKIAPPKQVSKPKTIGKIEPKPKPKLKPKPIKLVMQKPEIKKSISDVMTSENLVTVPVGTTLEQAEEILHKHRIEKLPVVDNDGCLRGLITVKDIFKRRRYPDACKDEHGRLRVGAAIGASAEDIERAEMLVDAGVDVIVVDTAHGHSEGVLKAVAKVRERFSTP